MEKQKPIHTVLLGRIKAAIWLNQGTNGPWYSVQVCRLYMDKHGKWQHSGTFQRDDLLLAGKVLDRAHSWIYEQMQRAGNDRQTGRTANGTMDGAADAAPVESF